MIGKKPPGVLVVLGCKTSKFAFGPAPDGRLEQIVTGLAQQPRRRLALSLHPQDDVSGKFQLANGAQHGAVFTGIEQLPLPETHHQGSVQPLERALQVGKPVLSDRPEGRRRQQAEGEGQRRKATGTPRPKRPTEQGEQPAQKPGRSRAGRTCGQQTDGKVWVTDVDASLRSGGRRRAGSYMSEGVENTDAPVLFAKRRLAEPLAPPHSRNAPLPPQPPGKGAERYAVALAPGLHCHHGNEIEGHPLEELEHRLDGPGERLPSQAGPFAGGENINCEPEKKQRAKDPNPNQVPLG